MSYRRPFQLIAALAGLLALASGACAYSQIAANHQPAHGARAIAVAAVKQRANHPPNGSGKPRILFIGMPGFPILDPQYQRKLAKKGYSTATATYQSLESRKALGTNILAITMATPYNLPFAGANKAKILHFVRQGGGLLLMVGDSGYQGISKLENNVNNFLAPMGAGILEQRVHDPKHRVIFSRMMSYAFYSTNNIKRGNPITLGVHRLWYPGGMWHGEVATYTMKLSPAWTILVRGDKSASSPGYPSAPPLVAVRSYGKGRIAIVTWDPRYCINNGFHPAYGGYMLGNKGNGFKLLDNLYDWLGEPSMKEGRVFPPPQLPKNVAGSAGAWGASGPAAPPPPPVSQTDLLAKLKPASKNHIYKGIIGVQSNLSGGHATVAAFCRAARKLGLNFLVFTQDYARMTLAKWRVLKQQCRANSTTDFVAMAGLRINGPSQPGERIVFNLNSWPTPAEVAPNAWPVLLFHHRQWPTVVIVHPHLNKMSPWQLKFYNALALVTYGANNKIQDHAFQEYRRLVGSDYRLIPCVVNNISSVPALKAAVGGWLTYTQAASVADIPASMQTEYGSASSFVSRGPVISDFAEAGGYRTAKYPADLPYAGSALPGSGMVFKIAISSRNPLTRVTLYRNNTVFRRYFPSQRRFLKNVWAVDGKNATYTVTARDSRGRAAISNQLHIYNPVFDYTMCVDKQNSILDVFKPNAATTIGLFISGVDTGQIMIAASAKQINQMIPAGVDASWDAIQGFSTGPGFYFAGRGHGPACRWRRGNFSSADCLISDNRYDGSLASATVKYIMFRPAIPGYYCILIKSKVKVKKTVKVENWSEGPGINLFGLSTNAGVRFDSHYCLVRANGKSQQGQFKPPAKAAFVPLHFQTTGGGYAAFWTNPAGNFAVYPADSQQYDLYLGLSAPGGAGWNPYGNYLNLGFKAPHQALAAGTVLHAKFLFVLDDGKGAPADFQFIRDAYGLAGHPAYQVALQHGRVLGTAYALTMQANDYYVRGSVSKAKLPNDHLGVIVKGVSDNWDAGTYDTKTKILRRVGTYHGAAYVLLNTRKANEFIIGNLVYADKPFIKLTLLKFGRHSLTVIAQNPTDKAVTATVGSLFSGQKKALRLTAGGTAELHLTRRK